MLVVGLSGGIGSGKTVASDHFARLNVPVIDTDIIARQIVEPGQPALAQLADTFGNDILLPDGALNRGALRDLAFSDKENKAKLDAITHPAIREETVRQVSLVEYPYCLVVVPLLTADSPFIDVMHRVLVVTADTEVKIERVIQRSNLSRERVLSIMATQLADEQRLEFADDVIENNASLASVYAEVERLNDVYLKLAAELD